jgi:hypothetical protein
MTLKRTNNFGKIKKDFTLLHKNTAIEIFSFQNGRYKSTAFANELTDKIMSNILTNFEINLSDIF